MKLFFAGRVGSRRVDWSGYALVRDNIQHFIEGGEPSERFAALHTIERAVDEGRAIVPAARLRGEVLRAWYALANLPLDDAAVSLRTRAIVTGSADRPTATGTIPANRVGWPLPGPELGCGSVADQAAYFIASVLSLTEQAIDGDTIEVRREGPPPRFASRTRSAGLARAGRYGASVLGVAFSAFCALALATACSTGLSSPQTPSGADMEQRPTTNLERHHPEQDQAPVVAPPAAYGNKVVLESLHGHPRVAARELGRQGDGLADDTLDLGG